MTDLRAIILAAGKGTRMKSDIPKVLHPVCGKAMIEYVIDIARKLKASKIYTVVGYKNNLINQALSQDIETVIQKKLLGTADAVKSVHSRLKNFKGSVLILCGDTPLLTYQTIQKLVHKHTTTKAAATFLSAHIKNPYGYGRVIRDLKGNCLAIREHKDASPHELKINEINTGVYCFKSDLLFKILMGVKLNKVKKEFYLTDTIESLVRKNYQVETVLAENSVEGMGINTKEELAVAQGYMRQEILRKLMLSGITIEDPSTTFIDATVKIGKDTTIKPFTYIEKDVVIGKRCVIGPFAHVRPSSIIKDDVQIGNFTEVSRSIIGNKTMMKHFSFLGDAVVGSDVNIGAGTITANYDGKNKNTTFIGDKAFIGSDSILIAPIKVGKSAIVGAGSVVTKGKNVPDKAVALGAPAKIMPRR